MNLPSIPTAYHSIGAVAGYLRSLSAAIAAGWNADHLPDGTHRLKFAAVPFSATDFTASGSMTWTVGQTDVYLYEYAVLGKVMFLRVYIANSSIGGVVSSGLYVRIPGGYTASSLGSGYMGYGVDNSVATSILGSIAKGDSRLLIERFDLASWTASANATSVQINVFFGVN